MTIETRTAPVEKSQIKQINDPLRFLSHIGYAVFKDTSSSKIDTRNAMNNLSYVLGQDHEEIREDIKTTIDLLTTLIPKKRPRREGYKANGRKLSDSFFTIGGSLEYILVSNKHLDLSGKLKLESKPAQIVQELAIRCNLNTDEVTHDIVTMKSFLEELEKFSI